MGNIGNLKKNFYVPYSGLNGLKVPKKKFLQEKKWAFELFEYIATFVNYTSVHRLLVSRRSKYNIKSNQ